MPRRGKKRAIQDKKPKLLFIESPVHGQGSSISPVLGASHPLTAKSVAADESSSLTWISPNFQELMKRGLSISRLRQTRTNTRLRHLSANKENLTDSRRGRTHDRLKPLAFLGYAANDHTLDELQSLTPPKESSKRNAAAEEHDVSFTSNVMTPEMTDPSNNSCDMAVNKKRKNCDEGGKGDNSVLRTRKSLCTAPNLIQSPLRILNFSCEESQTDSRSDAAVRRSVRLHNKYLESLKLSETPPREKTRPKVLVVDTPESEYGLSVRRRQLRGHILMKTS